MKTRTDKLSCLADIFLLQIVNYGKKKYGLRAKSKVKLKPEFKVTVFGNITCERTLGGIDSVNGNYYKMFIWKFPKTTPF